MKPSPVTETLNAPLIEPPLQTAPNPTALVLKRAGTVNFTLTFIGMFYVALLATVETDSSLKKQGLPLPATLPLDFIAFTTALAGKVAIVLFFNQPEFLEGFKKIWRKELPDFFNLRNRTAKEIIAWTVNLILSINTSLFWMLLSQASFKLSGELLLQYDAVAIKKMGHIISQAYFYAFFTLCSFYANIMSWPGIHAGSWHQAAALFEWLTHNSYHHNVKADIQARIRFTHQDVLAELHDMIKKPDSSSNHAIILKLNNYLHKQAEEQSDEPLSTLNITDLITAFDINQPREADITRLRKAYIAINEKSYHPESIFSFIIKKVLALALTVLSIYGFRNVIGLSHAAWKNLNLEGISRYGAGYLSYASMIMLLMITVYPMLCSLLNMIKEGMPLQVISNTELIFIYMMVLFIGICGGLANAEQSDMDGESAFDTLNSDVASFLLDAFAIYMILRNYFESKILQSDRSQLINLTKQQFLAMRNMGSRIMTIPLDEIENLAELAAQNSNLLNEDPRDYFNRAKFNQSVNFFKKQPQQRYNEKQSGSFSEDDAEIELGKRSTHTTTDISTNPAF